MMTFGTPAFTVFTATFNRGHTLERLYNSLQAQTFRNFEWVIVDDGSTDDTSKLVSAWQASASFPIRYCYQPNSGKHVAVNHGRELARGQLFVVVDSDDSFVPEALQSFYEHWRSIPAEERAGFASVRALCMDEAGKLVGKSFPAPVLDVRDFSRQYLFRRDGDRCGATRRDVLDKFPYPEIPNEKFVPEGLVWNRISRKFSTRYVNQALMRVEYRADGLSASVRRIRMQAPVGSRLYYLEILADRLPTMEWMKNLLNYLRFSIHAKIPWQRIVAESPTRLLAMLGLPLAWLISQHDRYRLTDTLVDDKK